MGSGGGCVIKTVSLAQYQQIVGNSVMTVLANTYTFVSGITHTIRKRCKVSFGINDRLVIAEGANITLEGDLEVLEQTNEIDIITVNGTFTIEKESTIKFESLQNSTGILVNSSNSLYINGGEITATVIGGLNSNLIKVNANGSVTQNNGIITVEKISELGNNSSVYVDGTNAIFTQNGGSITIKNMDSTDSIGLYIRNGGTFIQNEGGSIAIENINSEVRGIVGILIEGTDTIFTQNGGSITIKNMDSTEDGYISGISLIRNAIYTQKGGSITIENIKGKGITVGLAINFNLGSDLDSSSSFNQIGGTITIKNVGDNGVGVNVYDDKDIDNVKFYVNNLTISGDGKSDSSIGFLCNVKDGVINSGTVHVYDTKLMYSNDGKNETTPLPTAEPNNNEYFTGKTYYNEKE